MPTTRRQAKEQERGVAPANGKEHAKPESILKKQPSKKGKGKAKKKEEVKFELGEKREADAVKEKGEEKGEHDAEEPPTKKAKTDPDSEHKKGKKSYERLTGVIERGHIYFFYRNKVQTEEAHSIDDVKNLHMLLVPRPPEFAAASNGDISTAQNKTEKADPDQSEDAAMKVVEPGADAVPASEKLDDPKKRYRLIVVGKKKLPDPEQGGSGRGRKQIFWATVAAAGDDLKSLEQGLGEKTYDTKTRGTRHEEPARLAARGAYVLVNNVPDVPSQAATQFGYVISHPLEMGDVQEELGIRKTAAFVLQVKNPLAPATGPQQVHGKGAEYPQEIMDQVFGQGTKGREEYGLRFTSCEVPDLLDYEGAELLLIAETGTEEGLEEKLGEGRGEALEKLEEKESKETTETIFKELAMDNEKFPADPLEGNWI